MAIGKSSQGSSSKKSRAPSTSSKPSRSRHTGTGLGHTITATITPRLSDGSLTMRMAIPICTENLFVPNSEWINSLASLTSTQIQKLSIQLWLDLIAGLINLHCVTTLNPPRSPKNSSATGSSSKKLRLIGFKELLK